MVDQHATTRSTNPQNVSHRNSERAQQRASQQQMQEEAKHHHGGASVWTVPELLEKTGVEDLDELLRLSRAELQEQFGWLDPISWRRLQDALDEARQQPVWLSQEVQQVRGERVVELNCTLHHWTLSPKLRLAVVVSVGVLTGWGIGFYQHSILWALLAAYIVGRLWRTMAEKFLYRSSAHARRRAARSRVWLNMQKVKLVNLNLTFRPCLLDKRPLDMVKRRSG